MPKLHKILLFLVIALFLITRLYKISEIPISVYWDEASIGYNAYALSKDLKDEWGDFLPIHFRAFGEFKLPIYIYSVVPFVKIFGLNEFSVRFPAVLFSLGVVILIFLLARKLTGSNQAGIWSSFFITISPWFFIFSRTGYEATAGLMFYLLAIFFFLKNKEDGKFILFSIVNFIASAYSYNSFRIVSPLAILILLIWERDNLKEIIIKYRIYFLISIILLVLSAILILRLYIYDAGISRLHAVGGVSGMDMVKNYLSHFGPKFLFLSGDNNLRSQQAGFGQLYLPDLILIILGLLFMVSQGSRYKWLPLIFLLLGPIPAAITKESPHALRALSQVPFYAILSAEGVLLLGKFLKTKYLLEGLLATIFLGFFGHYFINFINVYPKLSSNDWQFEYKQIFVKPDLLSTKQTPILISEKYGQPYIFALFYLKYDPKAFRKEVVRNSVDKWGFSIVQSFGRYKFGE